MQRNTALKIVGLILMLAGIIAFVIGIVGLSNIETQQSTLSRDYRTINRLYYGSASQQKAPFYVTMGIGAFVTIAGFVMIIVNPTKKNNNFNSSLQQNMTMPYSGINCPHCGAQIAANTNFCSVCGNKVLPDNGNSKPCQFCGTPNRNDSQFCIKCGNKIQ